MKKNELSQKERIPLPLDFWVIGTPFENKSSINYTDRRKMYAITKNMQNV